MSAIEMAAAVDQFLQLPLAPLLDSPLNPRQRYDEVRLDELAQSIRQHGILEPLIVRPVQDDFEVVAGHRRKRAALRAGLQVVPCLLRQLTDVQVLEISVIENGQRENIHPLDEADGYRRLMAADPAYTVEVIAAKVGKSAAYIYRRLKLLQLCPEAREAFDKGEITAAHAERLARLTVAQQQEALPECFYPIFAPGDDTGRDRRDVQPVARLDAWIQQHTRVPLVDDDTPHYFPELHAALGPDPGESLATDAPASASQPAPVLLQLSESHAPGTLLGKNHGLLSHQRWTEIRTKKARCRHVQQGAVVHGGPLRILEVCATKGCPKHFPAREKTAPDAAERPSWKQQEAQARQVQEQAAERQRAWQALLPTVMAAFVAHTKTLTVTAALVRRLLTLRFHLPDIEKVVGTVTDENMAQAMAVAQVATWSREDFLRDAKLFGFDLVSFERNEKKKATPPKARAARAEKAGKAPSAKAATTRKKKG